MERALVTGAAGFVGAALCWALRAHGVVVTALVHPRTDLRRLDAAEVDVARVDLNDTAAVEAVLRRDAPDVVVHAAARGGHPVDRASRAAAWQDTVGGTISLWEALADTGTRRVVHLCSSLECAPSDRPLREDDPLRPRTSRGAMKAAALVMAEQRAAECGIELTALRLFAVYGPGEQPNRLVPSVLRALRDGTPFRLAAHETRRDFVHVDDVVDAAMVAAVHPKAPGETFNVGTGIETSAQELVERAAEVTGRPLVLEDAPFPARPADQLHSSADLTKVASTIGWRPSIDLTEGLTRTAAALGIVR